MSLQFTIDKLKGLENYKEWSATVQAYLEIEDLWSVVERGPDGSDKSRQKDKRAKFIILCSIEHRLYDFMVHINTANELWNFLRKHNSMR